jgi:hypothetical protein
MSDLVNPTLLDAMSRIGHEEEEEQDSIRSDQNLPLRQ